MNLKNMKREFEKRRKEEEKGGKRDEKGSCASSSLELPVGPIQSPESSIKASQAGFMSLHWPHHGVKNFRKTALPCVISLVPSGSHPRAQMWVSVRHWKCAGEMMGTSGSKPRVPSVHFKVVAAHGCSLPKSMENNGFRMVLTPLCSHYIIYYYYHIISP